MESNKRNKFIYDEIYDSLKQKILSFRYKPGDKLSEKRISAEYGASRSPVRSVFQKLESERLVSIEPQRGTYVTKLDMKYIRNIIYMRCCAEYDIMSTIALQQHKETFQRLDEILEEQRKFIDMGNLPAEQFSQLDIDFHSICYQAVYRDGLWAIIGDVNVHYQRFRMLDIVMARSLNEIFEDHCHIVEAMKEKDLVRLKKVLKKHLYGILQSCEWVNNEAYADYFTFD